MEKVITDLPQQLFTYLTFHGRRYGTARKTKAQLKLLLLNGVRLFPSTNIDEFLAKNSTKFSSGYLNNFIDAARNYAHMAQDLGLPYDPKLLTLKHFKDHSKAKATMSDEEIEAFVNLPCDTFIANRHGKKVEIKCDPKGYAVMTMFWKICSFSGMRTGEVASLKVNQIDFGRGVFVLSDSDTKTNTARYVPIAPNITTELQDYVKKLKGEYLFPSRRGGTYNGLTVGSVDWGYSFHKRIKRLGIKRFNLTPYSLRHSLITRLLEEDVNIFKVQKIVGHKDIKTTAGYTHLTTKDIVQAISKHPLIRKGIDPEEKLKVIDEVVTSTLEGDKRFEVSRNIGLGSLVISIRVV